MENMKIWDAVKQPPPEALKEIQAGRLKGKTDINPQWRYQAMTEQFGICGIGWKYEVEVWNEPTTAEQVFAFAKVNLYVKVDDKWSDSIPGIGGSMLVTKESAGLHASDEGYKMAITDALSVAMKMLGLGANVYAGLSGSKYKPVSKPPQSTASPAKKESNTNDGVKEPDKVEPGIDMDWLKENLPKVKWTEKTAASWLVAKHKVQGGLLEDVLTSLTKKQLAEFVKEIKTRLEMA